jgi:dolichol-phosphate mannosyltransferase
MAPGAGLASKRLFRIVQRAWPITIAASLLFYGASLHYLSLGLPGLAYPNNFPLVGCRDLGRQIERIEDNLELTSGVEPLVVGMDKYRIASLLAFYRPEMALSDKTALKESVIGTAGCHLFGGNSLMYQYWFPEKTNENKVMILVGAKRGDLEGSNIPTRVREMGNIQKLVVHKNGKPVGNYFYLVVKGYTESRSLPGEPAASLISANYEGYGNQADSLARFAIGEVTQ